MSPSSMLHAGDDAVKQSAFGAFMRAKQKRPGEIEMNMVPLKMQSIALNRKQVSCNIALRESLNKKVFIALLAECRVQLSSTPLPTSIRISYRCFRSLVGGSNISEMHEKYFDMMRVARSKLQDRVETLLYQGLPVLAEIDG